MKRKYKFDAAAEMDKYDSFKQYRGKPKRARTNTGSSSMGWSDFAPHPRVNSGGGLSFGRVTADAFGFVAGSWAAVPAAAAAASIPFVGAVAGPATAVAGGIAGAAYADSFFGPQVSLNKMKMNPEKALTNRSAMKVSGKTKVKKAPKKLKISSKFRESVKTVLRSASATGSYKVIKCGMVGSLIKSANGTINGDDMGSTFTGLAFPGPNEPSGSRTLFNALFTWQAANSSSLRPYTGLNFFTPAKILDAASVLFNDKTPGNAYATTTNNLATTFVTTTGANIPTNPGSLKVYVKDSSASFVIKNLSYRVVSMDIWECTPTLKFQNSPALAALTGLLAVQTDGPNNTNISYHVGPPNTVPPNSSVPFFDRNIDPLFIAGKIGFPFKWKKRTMILAPHETCVHKIQGPRGEFDFSKITSLDTTAPTNAPVYNFNTLMKGWSVSCIISISGDQILQTAGVCTGNRDTYYSGGNSVLGNYSCSC